jgi:predicted alpha/beta hydrolase family esterase
VTGAPQRRFLILHGWQNHRPPGHWQHWLAERLRAAGEQVLYPQLPDPDAPRLDAWLDVLRAELRMLGRGERIVITHSLGCLLWRQHARDAAPEHAVDRLLLVCPPGPSRLPGRLAPFTAPVPRGAVGRTAGGRAELVVTDDDPWCPEGPVGLYGDDGVAVHAVPGGGHLSLDEGYGPWPAVERWARTGRFDGRPAACPRGRRRALVAGAARRAS